jgi:hypothetical protein
MRLVEGYCKSLGVFKLFFTSALNNHLAAVKEATLPITACFDLIENEG